MMTYNKAQELFKTAKNKQRGKPLCNNTRLRYDEISDCYRIYHFNTAILSLYKDKISVNIYNSFTSRQRLNYYLPKGTYVFALYGNTYLNLVDNKHYIKNNGNINITYSGKWIDGGKEVDIQKIILDYKRESSRLYRQRKKEKLYSKYPYLRYNKKVFKLFHKWCIKPYIYG